MSWVDINDLVTNIRQTEKDSKFCSVVTFMYVFNTSYDKAHSYLARYGRKKNLGMLREQIKNALEGVRNSKVKYGPYTKTNRISLGEFCKRHPEGRYYVLVRGHALAVIGGIVHDCWHKPRRQVTGAWRVYLNSELDS